MVSFAEMYALVFEGDILGYRIYALMNNQDKYFDIQTKDIRFNSLTCGRIKLIRYGNYLVSEDELNKKYKVDTLTSNDVDFINELIKQVKHYNMLRNLA